MGAAAKAQTNCDSCEKQVSYLRNVGSQLVCRECAAKIKSQRFKQRYEDARKAAEQVHRQKRWKARIQIAKEGKQAFQREDFRTAVLKYEEYLRTLEEGLEVKKNEIRPDHFDNQAEQLVATAIFWDLARLYDRSPSLETRFNFYVEKFVLFTKKAPWEGAYRKNLKRYIRWGSPTHPKEFKGALTKLGGTADRCFIATATYGEFAPETTVLRNFRDQTLARSKAGRTLVDFYYWVSPKIAEKIDGSDYLKRLAARALGPIVSILKKKY